ncbi:MAG: hypothetical protein Q8K78_03825 [Planctomycetaceae bacterium]|nr:hypothetical protein [Planctomycetaceae bacterium]
MAELKQEAIEPKPDWFDRLIVPDVLRPKAVPKWREPLPETGRLLQRLGRLIWRAYRFSQKTSGKKALPGPAYDAMVLVLTVAFGIAWLLM